MCLAIYKPAKKRIKERWLENGYMANHDGAGFAWSDGEKITIEKGFFSFESFMRAYHPHQDDACVIHFRFATHGDVSFDNCHPWSMCGGRYALVHNGILNIQSSKEMSDTGHFVKLVLEPTLKGVSLRHPALQYLVEQAVGSFNKIAVLEEDGSAVIFNEKAGMWINGVWFSNDGYKDAVVSKSKLFEGGRFTECAEFFPDYNCGNEVDEVAEYYRSLGFSRKEAEDLALQEELNEEAYDRAG